MLDLSGFCFLAYIGRVLDTQMSVSLFFPASHRLSFSQGRGGAGQLADGAGGRQRPAGLLLQG